MEVLWFRVGLIAFGIVWLAVSVLAIAALVFDCWAERETKLRTPLPKSPATDMPIPTGRELWRSAGSNGGMASATELQWANDAWRNK